MSRKAAFFDMDGTLIKGFIITAFPDYLARRGFFDKKKNDRIQKLTHLYRRGKISYRYASVRVPRLYAAGIKGQKQSEIIKLASAFLREYHKNMLPYSKSLVSLMNRNNFLTIAISGSPIEVTSILKNMRFREIHGTEMEVKKGVYTGKVKRNLIIAEEKRKLLALLTRRYKIDMKGSFAFGDTEQDLAMLSRVGHPVPLNPSPPLSEYALKKGWRIPKDVLKEVKEML